MPRRTTGRKYQVTLPTAPILGYDHIYSILRFLTTKDLLRILSVCKLWITAAHQLLNEREVFVNLGECPFRFISGLTWARHLKVSTRDDFERLAGWPIHTLSYLFYEQYPDFGTFNQVRQVKSLEVNLENDDKGVDIWLSQFKALTKFDLYAPANILATYLESIPATVVDLTLATCSSDDTESDEDDERPVKSGGTLRYVTICPPTLQNLSWRVERWPENLQLLADLRCLDYDDQRSTLAIPMINRIQTLTNLQELKIENELTEPGWLNTLSRLTKLSVHVSSDQRLNLTLPLLRRLNTNARTVRLRTPLLTKASLILSACQNECPPTSLVSLTVTSRRRVAALMRDPDRVLDLRALVHLKCLTNKTYATSQFLFPPVILYKYSAYAHGVIAIPPTRHVYVSCMFNDCRLQFERPELCVSLAADSLPLPVDLRELCNLRFLKLNLRVRKPAKATLVPLDPLFVPAVEWIASNQVPTNWNEIKTSRHLRHAHISHIKSSPDAAYCTNCKYVPDVLNEDE